jgi:hypothetical protein
VYLDLPRRHCRLDRLRLILLKRQGLKPSRCSVCGSR